MRRFAAPLLVLFLLPACGHSSAGSAAAKPAVATKPALAAKPAVEPNGPLLWRVDGANGPLYLYGTIHTGGKDFVPQVAWDDLATTKTFVMETDLDALKSSPMELLKRAQLPRGESLDVMVGPETWAKVVAAVQGLPLSADQLKRFKPWFVASLLIQKLVSGAVPTDVALHDEAKTKGLGLEYLELWTEQIDAIEAAMDVDVLKQMVADMDKQKTELEALVAAYRAGDAAAIEKATTDPSQMTPHALDILLVQRNKKWIPKLEAYAKQGNVFVAVGVGHLVGKDGVVQRLRDLGYQVTRVTP